MTAIPVEDIPKYEGLLKQAKEKFDELKGWKEKAEGATPEFEEELRKALGYSSAAFNIFRDDQRFNRYDARQILLVSVPSPLTHFKLSSSPIHHF